MPKRRRRLSAATRARRQTKKRILNLLLTVKSTSHHVLGVQAADSDRGVRMLRFIIDLIEREAC